MEQLVDTLNYLVEKSGLSIVQNSLACGVSDSQMGKYLNGKAIPTIKVLERIALYFDCSFDYLCGLSNEVKTKDYKSVDMSVFLHRYEELLNKNKISHWKFAANNGFTEAARRKWRLGKTPKLTTIYAIARELGSSIDYLVGRV